MDVFMKNLIGRLFPVLLLVLACGGKEEGSQLPLEYLNVDGTSSLVIFHPGQVQEFSIGSRGVAAIEAAASAGWTASVDETLSTLTVKAPDYGDATAEQEGMVTLTATTGSGILRESFHVWSPGVMTKGFFLRVGTYNLWIHGTGTGEWAWAYRKHYLARSIVNNAFDVFGFQEMDGTIRSELPDLVREAGGTNLEWKWFGRTAQDGSTGEAAGVAYNSDRLELLDFSAYWISETPDVLSRGWDETGYYRIVTVSRFRERETGIVFRFSATHMPLATSAKANGAVLIANREKGMEEMPSFLVGDMNSKPTDPASVTFRTLWTDAYDAVPLAEHVGPVATFNGHNMDRDMTSSSSRIDYIYFRGTGVTALTYKVDDMRYNGVWPSDHLPVAVDFKISK